MKKLVVFIFFMLFFLGLEVQEYLLAFIDFPVEETTLAFFFGSGRRRNRAGDASLTRFQELFEDGSSMFNYDQDFGKIQDAIGGFQTMLREIKDEQGNPYLQTTEGKAFANQINENTDRSRRNLSNNSSMLGLTDEAALAGMNNINKNEANSFRSLVGNATSRQNQLRGQQMTALARILGGQNQLLNQRMGGNAQAMQWAQGGSNAYNIGFQEEANRQANNNANFTNLLGEVVSTLGGGGGSQSGGSGGGGFFSRIFN